MSDHLGDVVTSANKNAATSLASLKAGFSADDLIVVLNLSILNFPTAGAEIGPDELALLQSAAARIKMLPASGGLFGHENLHLHRNECRGGSHQHHPAPIVSGHVSAERERPFADVENLASAKQAHQ